jgi:hypothetical protein
MIGRFLQPASLPFSASVFRFRFPFSASRFRFPLVARVFSISVDAGPTGREEKFATWSNGLDGVFEPLAFRSANGL